MSQGYGHFDLLGSLGRGFRAELGGYAKKRPVFIVFYYEGGGVGRKVKRLWSYFLHHVFVGVFQYVPGPPKHVLHLVWSANVISTAE